MIYITGDTRGNVDFGKGFDETNLKRMRKIYLTFQKPHTLCSQLNWSHYRLIISLDDENARNFYIKEANSYTRD